MTADRRLSGDETGQHLGISSDTVYRRIDRHAMPARCSDRLWKFKKDEVDSWVKVSGASSTASDSTKIK